MRDGSSRFACTSRSPPPPPPTTNTVLLRSHPPPPNALASPERRLSLKRKTLSRAESTREHLETQYMSLRAHYVAASQRLATSRLGTDGVCKLLMSLTERRSKALGYRRVRLNVAREIQQVINLRLGALKSPTPELEPNFADAAELVKVWDLIENTVVASEQGCWDKELGGLVGESLKGNFKKEDGGNRKNVPRQVRERERVCVGGTFWNLHYSIREAKRRGCGVRATMM